MQKGISKRPEGSERGRKGYKICNGLLITQNNVRDAKSRRPDKVWMLQNLHSTSWQLQSMSLINPVLNPI